MHRLKSGWGACGEGVGLEAAFGDFRREVLLDEFFGLEVSGRTVESLWGDLKKLCGEVVGGLSAEFCGGVLGCGGGESAEED
jgi:hypothetical protein